LVHYPVSCSPQAWAAGAFFLLLSAVLGLVPDAPAGVLRVINPELPAFLDELELHDLRVGSARLALRFKRLRQRTHVDLIDASQHLRLLIEID
jgi:hypothetical protein